MRCDKHGVTRCMLCTMKAKETQAPPQLDPVADKQALEAIERNKSVQDGAPVEVDYGAWVSDPANIEIGPAVEAQVNKAMAPLTQDDPLIRTAPRGTHLAGNPIVDAAAAYTSAQTEVENVIKEVEDLRGELRDREHWLEEKKADRDTKKLTLQALVGGVV